MSRYITGISTTRGDTKARPPKPWTGQPAKALSNRAMRRASARTPKPGAANSKEPEHADK